MSVKVSRWRLTAAAAAGTVARSRSAHPLAPYEAPYIGVGFVLLTLAAGFLAVLLLVVDTRAVWVGTLLVAALALTAFVVSRTVGLPKIQDDIGNWSDPLGIAALLAEAVIITIAILQLTSLLTRTHPAPAAGSRV